MYMKTGIGNGSCDKGVSYLINLSPNNLYKKVWKRFLPSLTIAPTSEKSLEDSKILPTRPLQSTSKMPWVISQAIAHRNAWNKNG